MFSAYSKNDSKDRVFIKSLAKDIFDKNGMDLDSVIDVLFNELRKRDTKRIYTELVDIGVSDDATTYEILSAMADNTIALLNFENDSKMVGEIGSRLGGTMILFKKSSVYFSGGIFITYRYGEMYVGYPGVGGTSFIWSVSRKTIHSLHDNTSVKLTTTNAYEKINNWGGQSVNARLEVSEGAVTIPSGVHHIMVSACVVLECVEAGEKFLQIFKNDGASSIMVKQTVTANSDVTLCITPIMLDVVQGDKLDLRINTNSLDTSRMKHFTIEVID